MAEDRSFSIVVEEYVPYICTAIHNGGNIRKDLRERLNLSKFERWQEEDPHTGEFISSLPIRIVVHDSRYEYDLNRDPENCIYKVAWEKEVWNRKLTKRQIDVSLRKHSNYYKVLDVLIAKIESLFDSCLVFDIHSYNFRRVSGSSPTFNLGSSNVPKKFRSYLDEWIKNLSSIKLPFVTNVTKENDVFLGNGYQLKHVHARFKNTLVLATEIKKVYLDEISGDVYPEIIQALKEELKRVITLQAKFHANEATNITIKKHHGLLGSDVGPVVREVDSKIFNHMKNFDVLSFVSPINVEYEKKVFFSNKYTKNPKFKYMPLHIDSASLKRGLYALPVKQINDVTLDNLYSKIIDSYCDQIDLLSCREDIRFLYSSLKYFGAPSEEDIAIAKFLLKSPPLEVHSDEREIVDEKYVHDKCTEMMGYFGFSGKITRSKNLVANAVFHSGRNILKLKAGLKVSAQYANALAHHEIGIHMLTTENSRLQPLKIMTLGLPIDTKTQEGLAILSEYLSGNISLARLKDLSLRVMAVNHMIKHRNFVDTFHYLVDSYHISTDKAYYLTCRVYRGGGFTKDYLYLRGFKEIFNLYLTERNKLDNLFIGKTSLEFLPMLDELVSRGILKQPHYIPKALLSKKRKDNIILDYLLTVFKLSE
ncbi:MAG: flavohemoglobin expression-modulating QEGLA motif protein [Bdellovibrionota bacterium]